MKAALMLFALLLPAAAGCEMRLEYRSKPAQATDYAWRNASDDELLMMLKERRANKIETPETYAMIHEAMQRGLKPPR